MAHYRKEKSIAEGGRWRFCPHTELFCRVTCRGQAYISWELERGPTMVGAACFEKLWSGHWSYRFTKTLLRTMPTTGPDVLFGPGNDSAIVRSNDTPAPAISIESHNYPGYVDPHDAAALRERVRTGMFK
jgi:phosphoribosylformylglycinamidine synthase